MLSHCRSQVSVNVIFAFCFAICGTTNDARAALMFSFTGTTGNASADAGFQIAANFIQSKYSDNVNVVIARGFSSLGAGILGQAGSTNLTFSYPTFRNAVAIDATSSSDATYSASLPAGSFSMYTNQTLQNGNIATPYVDSTGANVSNVRLTTANAKALGLTSFSGTDATITFNSDFTWDFDNTNGITAGAQDFVGVTIHELMHAMGFTSGVDTLDSNPGISDESLRATALDFTRHSTASFAANARIDLTADARAKYYSLDGGLTNLTPGAGGGFSTGVALGDGRQASHWKDNLGLGIMDPTSTPAGVANIVTALDLQALDVIGWNLTTVPEPNSLALICIAVVAGNFYRRLPSSLLGGCTTR